MRLANQLIAIKQLSELQRQLGQVRAAGKTIGLVPTMGALHAGHISLAMASVRQCDVTVATIFVNPTQFAEGEDLDEYPRTLQADLDKLWAAKVDFVFAPEKESIYPPGFSTSVNPPKLAERLEGEFRPTHFGGVCTVVLKLLNMVGADIAFFGQKDFQQAAVLKQMVADLNVPTKIEVCPIIRDPDGLAMSSRNVYLSEEERKIALSLSQTLKYTRKQIESGDTDAYGLMTEMRQMLIDAGVTSIDYAAITDPDTLEVQEQITLPVVLLLAAHVGKTRLIDNELVS